ncbi:MAG: hypothetical protein JWR37_1135 [Mycobacterium sp.]|nr:hypothetical protein [Mycobacterium sp.]
MAVMRWLRRAPRICYATSPKGYWCTRTDRHAVHEAAGGGGRIYSRWKGDFPSEEELVDLFMTPDGFQKAISRGPDDEISAVDHNDLLRGMR